MLEEIENARSAAESVGVEDVGDEGEPINFWVLVQCLRVYYKRDDRRVLGKESRALEQSLFTQGEVDMLRVTFEQACQREALFEDQTEAAASGRRRSIATPAGYDVKELSKDGIRRLLRTLGVKVTEYQRKLLEGRIDGFETNGRVDFADYLILMRWALDANIANISG